MLEKVEKVEKIKIIRKDCKRDGLSHTTIKKNLMKEQNYRCEKCGKQSSIDFGDHELFLDHKIPISIGGEQIETYNQQILCRKCNKKKTKIDKTIINMFKKLELLETEPCEFNTYYLNITKEKAEQIYNIITETLL